MKATDFDLSEGLAFDPETGITTFEHNRMVVFNAEAIGLLRQELMNEVGPERTRRLLLQFGYQSGHADLHQLKVAYDFDTEQDLLSAGPVIHTYEGIVKAEPTELRYDRETGEFHFTGVWHNSYEAEQHLAYNEPADEPVCWTLAGYASGYATAFFGSPLLAMEPVCVGQGDDHCEWLLQPPSEWDGRAEPYLDALEQFYER